MKRFKEFISKPRGIYFSFVALLTLAVGLMTISFSYYVPTSTEITNPQLKNTLSIDGIEGKEFSLAPNEIKEVNLRIKSENEITTDFHITYENENVVAEVLGEASNTIEAGEEKIITVRLTNNLSENSVVKLNIATGYTGKDLVVDGIKII